MAALNVLQDVCVLLLIFSVVFVPIRSINLDAEFSVLKRGDKDSYFGYSVAQHQIVDSVDATIVLNNVLLVGAPKKIFLINQKQTGGVIYQCDAMSSKVDDACEMIEDGLNYEPTPSEKVDDQWLGVTVASQGSGKKVVACAHRYIKDNAALGVCYLLSQSLESDGNTYKPCERQSHVGYLQDFGLCQAGMSAAIGQDDALLMGAPGSVFWQGAVFFTNVTEEIGASLLDIPSPFDTKKGAEGKQLTPTEPYSYQGSAVAIGKFDKSTTLYYASGAPRSNNKGEVVFFKEKPKNTLRYEPEEIIQGRRDFSGFGSSLLSIDLNNDKVDDLIVGAPYLYEKHTGGAFYVYLGGDTMINKDSPRTEIMSRPMGEEECTTLGCEHARFGMALAKLGDVNMDNYQDFAVGAPYEGKGTVYIYHGSNAKEGFNVKFVQRISASDQAPGHPLYGLTSFGASLSGGMDLDRNGYPDLLVGAYESDAVALIRARPIIKLHPSVSVTLDKIDLSSPKICTLEEVKPKYSNRHCFGVKLCLSYTTKPEDSIKVFPKVIYKLEAERTRQIARVELQDSDARGKVVENRKIDLSPAEICATEYAILKSIDDKLNPIEFTFTFRLDDKRQMDPFPQSAVQNINLFPILDTAGSEEGLTNSVHVKVDFVKECGDDDICHSDLQFSSKIQGLEKDENGVYEIIGQKKNVMLMDIRIVNRGEPAYLTLLYLRKPEQVSFLSIDPATASHKGILCQDDGDDKTLLKCDEIGNPLGENEEVFFTMRLKIPQEMSESSEIYTLTAWVNTSSTDKVDPTGSTAMFNNDTVIYKFRVINKADVIVSTTVVPDGSILCKGKVRDASSMSDEADIGERVLHNFIVTNEGPGIVQESFIEIQWPYALIDSEEEKKKYLLYLMRDPTIVGPVTKCTGDIQINPLGIKEIRSKEPRLDASRDPSVVSGASKNPPFKSDTAKDPDVTVDEVKPLPEDSNTSRKKREAQSQRGKGASGAVEVLQCGDGVTECFTFKCMLGELEPKLNFVKITFDARLWESTLLSDYRKKSEVQVISHAKITVSDKLKLTQDSNQDEAQGITRAIPDFKETSGQKVQWWIILVAVLVGIIVLLVVILILYKLGFFRRRRPEDMRMYKAEKKQQAMLEDYDDDGA